MKLLIATIILAVCSGSLLAQTYTIQSEKSSQAAVELLRRIGPVKGQPFTADEVNESVQTLADGNRIVRNTTGKMYRNSEGRTRREHSGGMGGLLGSTYSFGQGVSIVSPLVQGYFEAAPRPAMPPVPPVAVMAPEAFSAQTAVEMSKAAEEMAKAAVKIKEELNVVTNVAPLIHDAYAATVVGAGQGSVFTHNGIKSKYETRTEELGTRDFEGVMADGTRRTTTIPAGAIGNDRPIEIVYERWFSKELGVVVYSQNTDPRSGQQTYRLTNIIRVEPDPSLFVRPTKVSRTPRTPRVTPTKATAERATPAGGVSRARP